MQQRKFFLTVSRYRVILLYMKQTSNAPRKEVRTVRLSVYLPEELHRTIMHRCVDENISFTKLAERLLREYLKTPLKEGGK